MPLKKRIIFESTLFTIIILSSIPTVFAVNDTSIDIESLKNTGDDLYKQGQYQEAISYYDKILEAEPTNIEVLGKKGDSLASLGDLRDAALLYEQVVKINRDHKDSNGILYLDKLLELEPQNVYALIQKGKSLIIYYDRIDEAVSYFDRVLEIEPANVIALFNKGEADFQNDKYEDAISWYDKALKEDPNHVDSLSSKGYALAKLKDLEQSEFYLNKALEIDPDNVDALYKKGSSLLNEANYEDAVTYFYEALKRDPKHFLSEIKLKLSSKQFPYKTLDGYAVAKVHDSNGRLVANIKVRHLEYLDHKIVHEMIDKWPVIGTITRDGQNYEVRQIQEDIPVDNRYISGGAHHYGIYFPEPFSEFGLIHASYWQYQIDKGDIINLSRTVFRPI